MFEEIASAIAQQNYSRATQLIETLKQEHPDHPWLRFYGAQVEAAQGNRDRAKATYQTLLQECSHRKLLLQVREALRQLETRVEEREKSAIAQALAQPGGQDTAVFILSALPLDKKQPAAQALGKMFSMDPYTARLQIPSRGWRLFRVGAMGELLYYTTQLQKREIPCFCMPLIALDTLNVFQVHYFRSQGDQVSARCSNQQGEEGTLTFHWSEVQQQVQGHLPIFEEVVTTDARRKQKRKTATLDYVQVCDLHLLARRTILRLCDQQYQFPTSNSTQKDETIRQNWVQLLADLKTKMSHHQFWQDFTPFGESAIAFPHLLKRITPHIDLKRRYETSWDSAFQLYSGLAFFRGESDPRQP